MDSGTRNKLNMLIMNILIGTDYLGPKIRNLRNLVLQFLLNLALEQIQHPNYEYSTRNWLSWPKIIDSGKFGPKTDMCTMFTNFETKN